MSARTVGGSGQRGHDGRIRIAGILIIAGLVTELATFSWSTPTGFVLMLSVGGGLVLLGMVLFLWAIVAPYGSGGSS